MNISDRAVSYLRTAVPALWGSIVTWVLATWVLPAEVVELLTSDVAVAAVTAAVILVWYALWRWLEPHVPDWVTRLVLGSAKTPTYITPGSDGAYDITTLTPDERAVVDDMRAIEGRDPLPDPKS
ncbi:hypothetical protein IF650_13000 [Cellulosimicrobium terreum]|nr:hypothetical protein [Cellulosimicrobium terreum]